ncbi:Xaa-Pro peptidase family protein [Corynebacterium sp. TAE3-ERU12]|uniref:M24 family metallopeptidase n=1 Tax=Corynebacterium sp. TAE3-ERU12 TaxID=2849491 RepID=UPI001C47BBF7|nr:Xaa-Pro peptidase family protein [Corynebacterium sp. TAE3-ERU12]MBV7295480.1 Xaa-Pro peptidase family protein [Corynebacterium sp. TAE3-ERU12]
MTSPDTTFDAAVYTDRLRRAAACATDQHLAGFILGEGPDLQYFLGSTVSSYERLTALVIPAAGTPTLLMPAVERDALANCPVTDLDIKIDLWTDGNNPHQRTAAALAASEGDRVGIGSSLTADHILPILDHLPAAHPVLAAPALRELCMSKDAAELSDLQGAADAIDRVHAQVPALLQPGRTERAVAEDLHRIILAEGHYAVDFVIVGSGPNGANPHHSFSDRVLADGDVVVVDIGGSFGAGYHSDCTRTYVIGTNPHAEEVYAVLHRAQQAAVAAVRPGATAADIDAAARSVITEAGYGENFIHRTGHGIGLSVHEEPFIMAGNNIELAEGMTFSVEPGIYLPDEFGMRLEDIVVVTADGVRSLNNCDRALVPTTQGAL